MTDDRQKAQEIYRKVLDALQVSTQQSTLPLVAPVIDRLSLTDRFVITQQLLDDWDEGGIARRDRTSAALVQLILNEQVRS